MIEIINLVIIGYFIVFFGSVLYNVYISRKQDKDFFGKPTINKYIFILGKLCSFLVWSSIVIQLLGIELKMMEGCYITDLISSVFFILSGIFIVLSFSSLKESSSFGLPQEETSLKTSGVYKICRNPMYLAFFLSYFGAILYTLNVFVFIFSLIGIGIHHKIIIKEEKFLEEHFGNEYLEYKRRVRRYL